MVTGADVGPGVGGCVVEDEGVAVNGRETKDTKLPSNDTNRFEAEGALPLYSAKEPDP